MKILVFLLSFIFISTNYGYAEKSTFPQKYLQTGRQIQAQVKHFDIDEKIKYIYEKMESKLQNHREPREELYVVDRENYKKLLELFLEMLDAVEAAKNIDDDKLESFIEAMLNFHLITPDNTKNKRKIVELFFDLCLQEYFPLQPYESLFKSILNSLNVENTQFNNAIEKRLKSGFKTARMIDVIKFLYLGLQCKKVENVSGGNCCLADIKQQLYHFMKMAIIFNKRTLLF